MDWKIEVIVVPVTDIDRAKAFYSEQLGFHVDVDDSPSPGVRIVQMTPPGSGCSVTIGTGMGVEMVPGTLKGVQICVPDIDAAHAELTERGVAVSADPPRRPERLGGRQGRRVERVLLLRRSRRQRLGDPGEPDPARPGRRRGVTAGDHPTAAAFLADLEANRSDAELAKIQRYFKTGAGEYGEGDTFIGVRMGTVFALARAARAMPLDEVERLLDSPIHEARAGALRIMAEQSKARGATDADRRARYELYLRRLDRIDNWDLVDLGAWDVVGRYLVDHPRDVLDELAASDDVWARRTAILATIAFIRVGQTDDAFRLAERLVDDPHDLVQKAVGGVLRYAGDVDRPGLERFLEAHAATMPRTALRYAIEKLEPAERAAWLARR